MAADSGEYTPETLASRTKIADLLLMQAMKPREIRSPLAGVGQLGEAALGGWLGYKAEQEQKEGAAAQATAIAALLGGAPAGVAPAAAGPAAIPGPRADDTTEPPTTLVGRNPDYGTSPPRSPTMATVAGTEDTIPLPQRNPLGALNPEFRSKFADLRTAAGEKGTYFDAPEPGSIGSVRSPQQQASLYAQGRTAPGPIVTGTTQSNHITGKALDVVPKEGTSEKQIGSVVSALMANDPRFAGMRSGATFSNLYDPLHVELNKPQGTQVASLNPAAGVGSGAQALTPPDATAPVAPPTAAPQPAPPPAPVQVAQAPAAGLPVPTDNKAAIAKMLQDKNPYVRKMGIELGKAAVAKQINQQPEYTRLNDEQILEKHSGRISQGGPGFKPLVDPAERAAHGIPPEDKRPYQVGPGNKLINPPAETRVTVDQRGETEYEKSNAKHFSDLNHEIPKQAAVARTRVAQLDRLGQLLSDPSITTGAGASLILDAKRLAKQAGIDVGDLGGAEAVRSLQNQYALEVRNPSGGAGMPGAMSDQDRNFLASIPPGLERTAEGNKEIGSYLKKIEKRSLDVERLRQDYVKRNKRLDDGFYTELADFADKNPLFPPPNKTDTGLQDNTGAASAPKIRKFNPTTGKIE